MISVIIPVYNAEAYIKRCLESIYNQTYKDYEVVIIDDGSTDSTEKICLDFVKKDKRFNIYQKENGGSASARNYALRQLKGEYIVFVDADDYIHPDYMSTMMNVAENQGADIVQCEFQTVSNYKNEFLEQKTEINVYTNIEILKQFCEKKTYLKTAVLWNKLYKTTLFKDIKFVEGKGIDDEYVICQVLYRAKVICEINNILYFYCMTPNSQMRSKPTLKSIDNVEAIELQIEFLKKIDKNEHLCDMLLYRYYSSVSGAYELVKNHFSEETDILDSLRNKLKNWKKALKVKEICMLDKCLLIMRIKFPRIFRMIHKRFE